MRGHIRRRSAGSWTIYVSAGLDHTGKRRRISRTIRGTKRDADIALTALLREVDRGTAADPRTLTVKAYFDDHYFPNIQHRVRPQTFDGYQRIVRTSIMPVMGNVKLAKLKPLHVQAVVDSIIAAGCAPGTAINVYRCLYSALKQACRWELLATNPAAAVSPPRPRPATLHIPTASEVERLLRTAHGTNFEIVVTLAATTGMRRGEILGLRWSDIDLSNATLRVQRSLGVVGNKAVFQEPKTPQAKRTIHLADLAVDALRRQRRAQNERRLLLGAAWNETFGDIVCDKGDGSPWLPPRATRRFSRLATRAGLGDVRLHDLRHAYATMLLEQGVHPKIASEALGHADPGFTLRVYSHVLVGLGEKAARAIDSALGAQLR